MNLATLREWVGDPRRCIDKAGGLDNYIMNTPEKKLASDIAMSLRKQISYMQSKKNMETKQPVQSEKTSNGHVSASPP